MPNILMLFAGLVLLVMGAEGLVRGSTTLALRWGLTPLMVGLTVVAFGTSSPELIVGIHAALAGNGDVAVGNVVGSNICNIALILGAAAVIRPLQVQNQLIRMDVPLMIGCSALLMLLLADGYLGRLEGLVLAVGLTGYLVFTVLNARKDKSIKAEEIEAVYPPVQGSLLVDVLYVVGGLALLVAGAELLVGGAVAIAESLGISKAVIGLTIVAVGTSLPELAATIVAAFKREGDLAVGNVVGSNIFNILGILGISSLIRPLVAGGIATSDFIVMTALALILLPLMRTGLRLNRWEGALLLLFYGGYMWHLVP